MKKLLSISSVTLLFVAILATPAAADVDSNPNAVPFGPGVCENGFAFEVVYGPNANSVTGHDPETGARGAGTSLWLTLGDGTRVAPLRETPGQGLSNSTVWCWWASAESPTGFVGADILFNAKGR